MWSEYKTIILPLHNYSSMTALTPEQLKEKGDNCLRENKYQEALTFYDVVQADNPQYSNPAIFSNRSLAHLRLGKYEASLKDALHCLEIDTNFSRGYQRKAAALNALGRYEEAAVSAETGYKLRGSDSISKGCMEEWVSARQSIWKPKVDSIVEEIQFPLPKELNPVLSDEFITIFLNILLARLQQTANGMSIELIQKCLDNLMEQLNSLLVQFGHRPIPCSEEWPKAVVLASEINPVTSKVAPSVVARLMKMSNEFASYVARDVDPVLYVFIRPIVSLMLIAITAQCISFNTLNTNYNLVQVQCCGCLPFFETAPLTSNLYIEQNLCVYKELLESIGITPFNFLKDEIESINRYISEAKALLPRLAKCPDTPEKKDVHEKIMVSVSLAMIRIGKDPGYDPVDYAPESGKAYRRTALEKPEELKQYVKKKLLKLQDQVQGIQSESKEYLSEFLVEDVEDLLWCSGM